MILLLTPLKIEFTNLVQGLSKHLGLNPQDKTVAGLSVKFYDDSLAIVVGGHGKVQFALSTLRLCLSLNPNLVICVGGAGDLTSAFKPGSVIVATETVEHDFKSQWSKNPLPKFPGDASALEKIMHLVSTANFKFSIHPAIVASGDEDITTPERAAQIRQLTNASAVGWEGAGGARSALMTQTPFLEIRSITDDATPTASEDFKRNINEGMNNIAQVIAHLLLQRGVAAR